MFHVVEFACPIVNHVGAGIFVHRGAASVAALLTKPVEFF
jgi:hypothetical protein